MYELCMYTFRLEWARTHLLSLTHRVLAKNTGKVYGWCIYHINTFILFFLSAGPLRGTSEPGTASHKQNHRTYPTSSHRPSSIVHHSLCFPFQRKATKHSPEVAVGGRNRASTRNHTTNLRRTKANGDLPPHYTPHVSLLVSS